MLNRREEEHAPVFANDCICRRGCNQVLAARRTRGQGQHPKVLDAEFVGVFSGAPVGRIRVHDKDLTQFAILRVAVGLRGLLDQACLLERMKEPSRMGGWWTSAIASIELKLARG